MTRITGWHVLAMFTFGFSVIIAVNLSLAFNAVRTFPGLEVKNSYVASQSFDADRTAQLALGWEVDAWVKDGLLYLSVVDAGDAVEPAILSATFGRATTVANDQSPVFVHDGTTFVAPVTTDAGNWNLRVKLRAADGTQFQQRIIVKVVG